MRANRTVIGAVQLGVMAAAAAAGRVASAALVESLPLNGTTAAAVGTDGVAVNGPTWTSGPLGQPVGAALFTRTFDNGSYVGVANDGGLGGLQSGTISFWAQWTGGQRSGPGGGYGAVVARQQNGSFSDDVLALDGSDPATSHVTFQLDNATGFNLTGATAVGDNAWNFIAVTFTPTTESLYVNGTLDASVTGTFDPSADVGAALSLGAWPNDGYQYATAGMADFRVYDTALTQPQIASVGAGGSGVPEPATAGALGVVALGRLARRRRPW